MKTNKITQISQQEKHTGYLWRTLFVFLLCCFASSQAFARSNWGDHSSYWDAKYDTSDGSIYIEFLHGDDGYGPANEDGFIEDMTVKVNDAKTLFIQTSNGGVDGGKLSSILANSTMKFRYTGYSSFWSISGSSSYTFSSPPRKRYIYFRWYPKNTDLPINTINVKGWWEVNGVYKGDDMNGTRSITIPQLRPISITGHTFDTQNKKTTLTVTKSSQTSVTYFNNVGKYYLYYKGTESKVVDTDFYSQLNASSGGTITLDFIDESIREYELRHEYKLGEIDFTVKSASYKVPAFTVPKSLDVTFDDVTRIVKLQWNMSAVFGAENQDYVTYPYEIQRKGTKSGNNTWTTLTSSYNYSPSATSVTYEDKSFEEVNAITDTYTYRVKRKTSDSNWGTNMYASKSIAISTEHMDINPLSLDIKYDPVSNSATITWDVASATLWSRGSKFVITRYNRTANTREEIILQKDDLLKKEYVDNMINMCNRYYYTLAVIPGGYYLVSNAAKTDDILPTEIGKVNSFTASKGYFSERVELRWEATGACDKFVVQRKEHGAPDESYLQILVMDGSSSVSKYNTEDRNGLPGLMYDYRVFGVVNCTDSLLESNKRADVGFRTPTGDIYGRITFENGQSVENVEVNVTTEVGITGKSLKFDTGEVAYLNDKDFLKNNNDSITIQAWISPENYATGKSKIVSKDGMYELGIENDLFYFKAGTAILTTDTLKVSTVKNAGEFMHVTGVFRKNNIKIYVNGNLIAVTDATVSIPSNSNQVNFGGNNFKGIIDEIRIWSCALNEETIKRDYNRYITGGEANLIGYWNFNFATSSDFYDISYKGSVYNEKHGKTGTALLSNNPAEQPTEQQLGYRGVTLADGSYFVRSIPYIGDGTPYYIMPKMGIHAFEPQMELRNLSSGSQSHTVNFIDKSSFKVTGFVYYADSDIPVQNANFAIDGKLVLQSNGIPEATDANGKFTINVPVGIHEVKATMVNHEFKGDGRITDQYGQDLNYQDSLFGFILEDITKVKYIGRVSGGAVQEAYPLGHSLSKNNLAKGMEVTLSYGIPGRYKFGKFEDETRKNFIGPITETIPHLKPSNKEKAHVNSVKYGDASTGSPHTITIFPNDTTGEFVAYVIPEQFTVSVKVPGHLDVENPSTVDLRQMFTMQQEVYAYQDSVQLEDKSWEVTNYSDTARFQAKKIFSKRYTPEVRITQLDNRNQPLPYFGIDTISIQNMIGEIDTIPVYNAAAKNYMFGYPVFVQYENYKLKMEIFEKYQFYDEKSEEVKGKIDEVPTQDAKIKFNNDLANKDGQAAEVEADEKGVAFFTFVGGDPSFSGGPDAGIKTMNADIKYGAEGNSKSISWKQPDDTFKDGKAFIIGAEQQGTDFVTMGPDKVLMVLRDPPGSNSYSYLEKGVSFEESSAYTGSVKNTGNEDFTLGVKTEVVTFAGMGGGTINKVMETESGLTLGIQHEEEYQGQDARKSKTTTTTRFETSSDPLYVGANGDLYIGYSTNVTFGKTQNFTIVDKEKYDAAPGSYPAYFGESSDGKWALVQSEGLGANQVFSTLFAYTQIHIEDVLIPKLESGRNSLLVRPGEYTYEELQTLANQKDTVLYLSYFDEEIEPGVKNPHFGKSNDDPTLKSMISDSNNHDYFNGPSYRVIYNNQNPDVTVSDSIVALNQAIVNWEKQMAKNEQQKLEAELLQNYSFQAGAQIEYSESYSTVKAHESSFYIMIGGKISNDTYLGGTGPKTKFEFTETVETQHGGTFTSEVEASHCKGFVLAEDGDDDYLTVDVCREKGWKAGDEGYGGSGNGGMVGTGDIDEKDYYSTFIFRTRGGVTSCPYEGGYVTKYYQPGTKIDEPTLQLEVPVIDMPVKFIENVPSGETAKLQLYLRNESESQEDVMFGLKIIDSSNPNGARMSIDGGAIGNGREFFVPAGGTLVKTLEVGRGSVMDYDGLQLLLYSQCQYDPGDFLDDIGDTVTFSVHFTPSCTDVNIRKPSNNWTYNTRLPIAMNGSIEEHYMDVLMDGFNVNYDNFHSIRLQYKSASQSDDEWTTLMTYFNDPALYDAAVKNGVNAEMIDPSNAGTIPYRFFMDGFSDQRYDLRAVSVCVINNQEVLNESEVRSGIKDMYRPRLFGVPQPADGILSIEDDVRLNFNETIAEGLLTLGNFQVRGVRNGSVSDRSVSVRTDGKSDYLATEFEKSLAGKDITVEMWIQPDEARNTTLFSHGNINESLEFEFTSDKRLKVKVGNNTVTSDIVKYEQGSWAHVAFVYEAAGYLTAYYNYDAVITRSSSVGAYNGIGNFVLGKSIASDGNFYGGKISNVRVWEKIVDARSLQLNSSTQLSGNEAGLVAYYPMDAGKGALCEDKARGASMIMNGCEWVMPDGFAVTTNGANYLEIVAGTYAFTKEMDFTIEFWFKGEPGQKNATMLSSGIGDGTDLGGSDYKFSIGFDAEGLLTFVNNSNETVIEGNYLDNNWHHFAFSVDRTIGRAQVYMDGNLTTYIDAAAIGGISSSYIYAGARGWFSPSDPNTVIIDNYFKGSFDDLRFWNLYRSENVITENNNVKLSGEELGLIHYYPFDTYITHQGVKYLEFTEKDMRNAGTLNPETDKFTVKGSAMDVVKSKDIAPLKDFGPVADLDFDFVVNNDALIINLLEPEAKIAKTIITFTVTDVRDVNGNSIASPITWSAYIDRNQLKWSEDRLNLSKDVYEQMSFSVRALNNGGSIMRYSIDNLPSWLDATPMSGTLNPASYDEIVFTVSEGLNVGTYNEVIYLTNKDNNVSEALTLNLKVNGKKPDWSVNPKDFKYSMNVFGKMRFNNLFSADEGDMLAVFQNSKCVGVTTSTYNKPFDMWYALLTIYSNDKQHGNLEFRMWDASTGKVYKATPDVQFSFANDAVVGTVDNPVIFDGKEIFFQNILLAQGWNWISFNLADENMADVNKTLKNGDWTALDIVKSRNYFDSYSTKSKSWTGTLSKLEKGFNNTSMYMLHSSKEQTLSLSGTAVDTKATPITVKGKQWNYIGYLPSVNTTVKEAMAGYDAQAGDIVKSQSGFAMFSRNEWVGNLTYMEANNGYMLYRTASADATFTYPSVSASLSNVQRVGTASAADEYINTDFAENMILVATTSNLQPADRILAYINGELRGVGTYNSYENTAMSFITVAGDEQGIGVQFDLERNGEVIGTSITPVRYALNDVRGTIENPMYLDFGIVEENVTLLPNPFTDKLFVEVTAEEGSEIEVSMFDVVGRAVFMNEKQTMSGSMIRIEIDGTQLVTGVYVVQVNVNGVITSHKVEKK